MMECVCVCRGTLLSVEHIIERWHEFVMKSVSTRICTCTVRATHGVSFTMILGYFLLNMVGNRFERTARVNLLHLEEHIPLFGEKCALFNMWYHP
jgi:hypothetical protein